MTVRLLRGFVSHWLIMLGNRAGLTGRPKTNVELRVEALGWWIGYEPMMARLLWRAAR